MVDKSRVVKCPHCEKLLSYQLVRVKCPYCDKVMVFSLPEYAFYNGQIGCEHCHRKSHLKIGGYYNSDYGRTLATSEPVWRRGRWLTTGGRLLSIEPVVPTELVVGTSNKIPDGRARIWNRRLDVWKSGNSERPQCSVVDAFNQLSRSREYQKTRLRE